MQPAKGKSLELTTSWLSGLAPTGKKKNNKKKKNANKPKPAAEVDNKDGAETHENDDVSDLEAPKTVSQILPLQKA